MVRLGTIRRLFDDAPTGLKHKIALLYVLLLTGNGLAWLWAFVAFRDRPLLLATASLAYAFGLRHAVDPDHIAAIDNVTRKLMQYGKRPITAGFFFALGHSTIVIIASLVVALSFGTIEAKFGIAKEIGGVIGTSVSAAFLFLVAVVNTVILMSVYRAFRAARRGEPVAEAELDHLLNKRGLLARILQSLFGLINRSWHMYPLGFLFGLGFDTASEIALLGISAAQGSAGLPIWCILIFPALFTAGMSLIDTSDGVLMVQAYGWAFINPVRKLYYNLTMTIMSILVALLIGGLEALGLIANQLGLEGGVWDLIDRASANFGLLGSIVIGVFLAGWMISVLVYRLRRFDDIDRIGPATAPFVAR